jgi:hypothetical protein
MLILIPNAPTPAQQCATLHIQNTTILDVKQNQAVSARQLKQTFSTT